MKDSKAKFLQHLEESTFNELQQAKLARLPDQLNSLMIGHEIGCWKERPAMASRVIDDESLKLRHQL